jgi:hypothetical protein
VISEARLQMQTAGTVEPMMWQWENETPRSTIRSMFGVRIAALPRAWIVSKR